MALWERDLEPAFTERETEARRKINFLDAAERTSAFCFAGLLCMPHLSCPVGLGAVM